MLKLLIKVLLNMCWYNNYSNDNYKKCTQKYLCQFRDSHFLCFIIHSNFIIICLMKTWISVSIDQVTEHQHLFFSVTISVFCAQINTAFIINHCTICLIEKLSVIRLVTIGYDIIYLLWHTSHQSIWLL